MQEIEKSSPTRRFLKTRSSLREHGNVNLVLQEVGNAFQVQFVKKAVTTEVTTEVSPEARLVSAVEGDSSRQAIMDRLGLRNEEHFRKVYLLPALELGLIERTIPDKPRSSKQKYRLTDQGRKARRRMGDVR